MRDWKLLIFFYSYFISGDLLWFLCLSVSLHVSLLVCVSSCLSACLCVFLSHRSSLGPHSGCCPANPGRLIWSLMTMMSPTLKSGQIPPEAFVTSTDSTPISLKILTGKVTWDRQTGQPSWWNHDDITVRDSPDRGSNLRTGGSDLAWRHRKCPRLSQTPGSLHDPPLRQTGRKRKKDGRWARGWEEKAPSVYGGRGWLTCADGEVGDVLIPEGLFVRGSVSQKTESRTTDHRHLRTVTRLVQQPLSGQFVVLEGAAAGGRGGWIRWMLWIRHWQ